jgi:GT2 family glycosyltransferase
MSAATVDLVTEIDLGGSTPLVLPLGTARVLGRLHGQPLGFTQLAGPATLLPADVLAFDASLQTAYDAHLAQDGTDPACRRRGPWGADRTVLSVIIGTKDRPDFVRSAIASMLGCTGEFELIIVENGGTSAETREVVEACDDPRVRYLSLPSPGLSRARNLGAREARGEILAFTDDDVRIDSDWVEALLRAFTLEPGVGMVTGMVPAAELATAAQVYFDERVSWSRRCSPASFRVTPGQRDPLLPFRGGDLGTGANIAVSRRAFEAVGGFDERLGPGTPARGGEDLDLFARMLLDGWVLRYEPGAIVWHYHRRETEALLAQMRGYGSGLTAYLAKHALTGEGSVRLAKGLVVGLTRMGRQHHEASAGSIGPELVKEERRGLVEGPLLFLRHRRGPAPEGSTLVDVDVPVLEMLDSAAVPDAAAALLVTAHGHPIGLLELEAGDPRAAATRLFGAEIAAHQIEQPGVCSWRHQLPEPPPVTVVVPTIGDRPGPLRALLEALLAQTYSPLTVLLVDNRPGTWDRSGLPTNDRIAVLDVAKPGVSAARNAALEAVSTAITLFLDDDVVPSADWAGWLTAALHATPGTTCATGLILPLETRTRGQQLLEEWGGFDKGFTRQVHRHPTPDPVSPLHPYQPGLYGSGANVGFWTDRLRALGGYDEVLGAGTLAHGGEDLAVQLHVVVSGDDLVYEPAAVVWHRHRASYRDWQRQLFWYGAGLSAAMLRRAGRSAEERREILRRIPAAATHARSPGSTKNTRRTRSYPRRLVLVELGGMAFGPVALWRSKRAEKRS